MRNSRVGIRRSRPGADWPLFYALPNEEEVISVFNCPNNFDPLGGLESAEIVPGLVARDLEEIT